MALAEIIKQLPAEIDVLAAVGCTVDTPPESLVIKVADHIMAMDRSDPTIDLWCLVHRRLEQLTQYAASATVLSKGPIFQNPLRVINYNTTFIAETFLKMPKDLQNRALVKTACHYYDERIMRMLQPQFFPKAVEYSFDPVASECCESKDQEAKRTKLVDAAGAAAAAATIVVDDDTDTDDDIGDAAAAAAVAINTDATAVVDIGDADADMDADADVDVDMDMATALARSLEEQ